jgi:hypothetical protein
MPFGANDFEQWVGVQRPPLNHPDRSNSCDVAFHGDIAPAAAAVRRVERGGSWRSVFADTRQGPRDA